MQSFLVRRRSGVPPIMTIVRSLMLFALAALLVIMYAPRG